MSDMTWAPLDEFPGYEVNKVGQVLSRKIMAEGVILTSHLNTKGRPYVTLFRDGRRYAREIHVLMAAAFLGPRPRGHQVRHLNGNKLANVIENLEYGTASQNRHDSVAHGTHPQASKTHCPANHEYTPENIIVIPSRPNVRYCRACNRKSTRERMRRKRAEARQNNS